MKEYFSNLAKFLIKSEKKIVLILGIFAIILVSFTFGVMKGKRFVYAPIVVTLAENLPVVVNSSDPEKLAEKEMFNTGLMKCVYVGSKNGAKYYPPTCEYAKKIKPENLRCFTSDEDAVGKGYERASSCN